MNYNTERVRNFQPSEVLSSDKRKLSQEYYVLAVLKQFYPDIYMSAEKKESPDIWSIDIGIEVTVADSVKSMKASGDFSSYCEEYKSDEIYSEKISKLSDKIIQSGEYSIFHNNLGISLWSGGGVNCNSFEADLSNRIWKKIRKKEYYPRKFQNNFGVAVLYKDLIPKEIEKMLPEMLKSIIGDNKSINFLYIITERFCLYINCCDWSNEKNTISKELYQGLNKIARMTAEKIINIEENPVEWK